MITKLNSRFGVNYLVTTRKDLLEFAKKYLTENELKEMVAKVNNYINYEWVSDDEVYIGVERKSSRTYLIEII